MAVPIQTQLFDAFLGEQQGVHSIILPDVFSSGGSLNLYIDKYGRAKKISGYEKRTISAVTTSAASATRVRNLFPYRGTAGGSTTRQVVGVFDDAVDEWELKTSADDGVTWTLRVDLGATSIGRIADFAQFGDNLYIVNGVMTPRVWNGTTLDTASSDQSPTPSVLDSGDGPLSGTYRYKLVSVQNDGDRDMGSLSSSVLFVEDAQVTVSWTADPDTNVVGYELYRTTGTGTLFYFVAYINDRTTITYLDRVADETIIENRVMEEHGDAPPVSYFCEPHKQRMWWLRTDASPTRAYWSDPGEPESVWAESYLEFSDSETVGDVITGAIGNFEGLFVVFTEKAIWTVSGTGAIIGNITDWTRARSNAQTGCVSHRAACRVPAGSKYTDQQGQQQTTSVAALAYLTPLGDIRLFDGISDIIISHPVKDTLGTLNYAQRAKSHCVIDSRNDQVIWFIPTGTESEPDKAVVWNRRWGVWYVWDPLPMSASVEIDTSTEAAVLLTGEASLSKGGYVYEFFSGNSFDGEAFESHWMTKTLHGMNDQGLPALSNRKRWRWADFLFEVNQDVTLTVEWMAGGSPNNASPLGSAQISPAAAQILTSNGDRVTTVSVDLLSVAQASAHSKTILKDESDYVHDEGIRLRIGDNASNGSWSLEGFSLAYQILPGLQRRSQ